MVLQHTSDNTPYLRRKPSGIYEIVWYQDGVRKRRTTGLRDISMAKFALPQILENTTQHRLGRNPNLSQLIDVFLRHQRRWKTKQQHATMTCALNLVADRMGRVPIGIFGQHHVDQFTAIMKIEVPPNRSEGFYSTSTIRKALVMLRACLNDAAARRYIARAPTFRIRLSDAPARNEFLSPKDVERLLNSCRPSHGHSDFRSVPHSHVQNREHLEGFVLIAVTTGARKQAILDLRWSGVHLSSPTVGGVANSRTGEADWIDFGQSIGNKRRPKISISHNSRLLAWLHERASSALPDDQVIQYHGRPVSNITKGLLSLYKDAGLSRPSAPAHIFKHTAITWMMQANVPIASIAAMTNTSEAVLTRVYGHHSADFRHQLSGLNISL
ncbi:Phage integrase family protein [Roseivivax lentus]|uniref:Phage integrase family protein n=1 Tax=Roseivivax lentus TaxID=633194 RepID=A0A1N7NGY8_9RHOB|nr:tyrosine-type recombinase/integrase [Roseivivax lentus]SIS97645.1 Phage integrase family protein [Roseivivax lentus]